MSPDQKFLSIISGRSRGIKAALARAGLSLVEPIYATSTRARNVLFDRHLKHAHSLGRPAISVGNLTTGGTGKTPVVQWLAQQLIKSGHHPAVLLRGYRAQNGISDEAELYRQMPGVEVEPDPDRIAAAARVLARAPETTVFLLDDAFQHRRVKRDVDLVLIDATNPFGHRHVLPRGLLRERISGLGRADVILITHADATPDKLLQELRTLNPTAPIFQCRHVLRGLIDRNDKPVATRMMGQVSVFAGIGNPDAFFASVKTDLGLTINSTLPLADHQEYDDKMIAKLRDLPFGPLVTTEKDWMKLRQQKNAETLPIHRAVLALDFHDDHEEKLFGWIKSHLKSDK